VEINHINSDFDIKGKIGYSTSLVYLFVADFPGTILVASRLQIGVMRITFEVVWSFLSQLHSNSVASAYVR
jgi:hypothetical protein